MGALNEQMATRLPAGFVIPVELTRMLMWIDENGWVCRGPGSGDLYGTPYPEDDRSGSLAEFGLAPAEEVASHASGWLGTVDPAIYGRLCPFVQTGADGSYAAFWLDAGVQRIVHMGSGSGSTLACVLGTPLDFLRLLAIGYDEICWNEAWASPPSTEDAWDGWQPVNTAYREWLSRSFGITAPVTALEVVSRPAEMGDEDSGDAFCEWVNKVTKG